MVTLGIDLSADDRRTAACTIAWRDGRAEVVAWGGRDAGLDPQGYKNGPHAALRRAALVAALCDRGWLGVGADTRAACERSDHVLDALLAPLATRAAACGLTRLPETAEHRRLAVEEGWIHVPVPGSLDALAGAPAPPVA